MYSLNIFSLLGLIVAELYFLVGIYILARNPKAPANRLFFFLSLTMVIWGMGEGMERASFDPQTAFFWANYIAGLGATLHGPVLLHFWLEFSTDINKFKKRLPVFALYIPAMVLLAIRFFYPSSLLVGVTKEYWGYSTVGTPLYQLYMLVIAAYISVVVYLALRKAFKSFGRFRQQVRNIGLSILASLVIGVITQTARPLLHLDIPELSVISTFIFISFIVYSMNRYGLLNITEKLVAENILSTMEDYMVIVDKNLQIVLINTSVVRNLGYTEKELLNKPMNVLLSGDITSLTYDELFKLFPLSGYQTTLLSKNGDKIPISANAVILKEDAEEVFGFVFILRDMRQMMKLINDLQQKTKELETSNEDFQRMNQLMIGREVKMVELKKEIEELRHVTPKKETI